MVARMLLRCSEAKEVGVRSDDGDGEQVPFM